jgi:predicted permease
MNADSLRRDLALASRRLLSTPAFTVFSILTLGLGIAATTAVLSIVRAVAAPPSGVRDPQGIANIYHAPSGGLPFRNMSYGDYQDLRAEQTSFASLTAWTFSRFAIAAHGQSETSFGEIVGGEYFDLLGVKPALGRSLGPSDDTLSAAPVAVLSYETWRSLFDGAPDVIGRTVTINGQPFDVVGVAPRDFHGLFNNGFVPTAAWIPIASVQFLPREGNGYTLDRSDRDRRWLLVKGRLKTDRTFAQAQSEVTAIGANLDRTYALGRDLDSRLRLPKALSRREWTLRPMTDVILNENADFFVRPLMAILLASVLLVLLVACSNLANLMVARATGRRHEFGVRLALGASRTRLIRESVVESILLAAAGGCAGIMLAKVLLVLIGSDLHLENVGLHLEAHIDALVLAGAAAASLLALIASGLGPALHAARTDIRNVLSSSAGAIVTPRWRGRRLLIGLQVMTSLALLVVASACIMEVRTLSRHDSGMDLDHLAIAQVDFASQKIDATRARAIGERVLEMMQHRPDVDAVAVSSALPVLNATGGRLKIDGNRTLFATVLVSSPGIFKALGVPILHGRGFDAHDSRAAAPVAIVSRSVANALFGGAAAVGRPMAVKRQGWAGEPEPEEKIVTIAGITADTDTGSLARRGTGTVYLPFGQENDRRLVFSARSSAAPGVVALALRKALAEADPNLAVQQSGIAAQVVGPPNLFAEVAGGIAGVLGTFALVLALTGLYGALSHAVAGRTREIGVRLALGSGQRRIVRMVLIDGMLPVACGIAAGGVLGVIARFAMRPAFVRLFPALDAPSLIVAPICMLVAALAACYLPARRASRADPNTALREW